MDSIRISVMWKSIARQDLLRAWYRVLESVVNDCIENNWKDFCFLQTLILLTINLITNSYDIAQNHKNVVTHNTF